MLILRVAVSIPVYRTFDYLPAPHMDISNLRPGMRLKVPFGNGTRCGLLVATSESTTLDESSLKSAVEVLDAKPLVSRTDLELLIWVAGYYQHHLGEVVFSAFPTRLRKGYPVAKNRRQGWRVTTVGAEIDVEQLRKAPKQASVLRQFQLNPEGFTREDIALLCGHCGPVVRTLNAKSWLEPCVVNASAPSHAPSPRPELNVAQQRAVATCTQRSEGYRAYLIDGVTGSGKTEVYLALIEEHLAMAHQVLVLVPEIALTPQLLNRFCRRIQAPMAVLHSGLAEGSREQAWKDIQSGRARVLLGTRSAVFTPMPALGLIVVDEEHDLSYKQQQGFRYSARDMAVARARQRQCPVVLGSATPSLESLRNAQTGRYTRLVLPERAGAAVPPRLDLLDLRSVHLLAGLSPALLGCMRDELKKGNQVLLFLNRRGYAPVLICHDCGWVSQCSRCDARMTLHKLAAMLWCHHCGHHQPPPQCCPDCKQSDLRLLGQGTERLEEILQQHFPTFAIARVDRDSTRGKGVLQKMLKQIREGKYRILIGTQMLAKGHHFPDVTLVGILDIDQGLFGADYRSAERMAQLIVQVSGRAGRADKPGRVLLQTRHPEHPLLQTLIHHGYAAFASQALRERREAQLPPYTYQALLRAEATSIDAPRQFLDIAKTTARNLGEKELEIWGPVPAPMEKRAGHFRAHLLVQAEHRKALQHLLSRWVPQLETLNGARRVRWSIDVDPQEML